MAYPVEPVLSFDEAPASFDAAPARLFSVFFLDPDMASKRLTELTEFAVAQREATWTEKAAIRRALALVIPRAHESVAAQAAQALALNHLVDPLLADTFLARRDESSRIILSESAAISQRLTLQIAALGSDEEARALTARTDLDEAVLHILLNRRDRPIDILLAENHGLALSRLMLERMMTRAMLDPALCRSLFDRPDLRLTDRAALFIHAAMTQRTRFAIAIAEREPAALMPTGESPGQEGLVAELGACLAARDHAGFVNVLARHLNADTARVAVALMEPSGAVLLLIAILIGAPDAMTDRMQRAWARPMPQDTRKRREIEDLRRHITPQIAGFILTHILATEISEDRSRYPASEEEDADRLTGNRKLHNGAA